MKPKYAINKAEGEHLSETNRRHLAREWNKRIEALDAKLSFHGFAKMMRIPASTWRREYYRGGGIRPVVSGSGGHGGVFVVYDRLLRKYCHEKLASIDQTCVVRAIRRIRASRRIGRIRSVVTDNGCEFLDQSALDRAFQAQVFYTRAYASYEKGDVENCNRILRRWFPKGTDFAKVSAQRLHQVERYINAMHRPSLGGLSADQRARNFHHVA